MSEAALPSDASDGAAQIAATSERIEALLTAAGASGEIARERAEELVRLVADLYGAGLERLLDVLHDLGRLDDEVLAALAADKLVAGLLLVHGLHPQDAATRVAQALDGVRPYLGSHGGDVELVDVGADGTVRLRLTGSCDGCASSATTLELAVEGAIRDAAPEVGEIEVLAPAPTPQRAGVIPIASLRARTATDVRGRWETLSDTAALSTGDVIARSAGGLALVVCAIGGELFAFRDRCPACDGGFVGSGNRLARSPAGAAVLRCPGCGAHFDVRRAGASLDSDGASLQPLPLLVRDGVAQVAVPAEALS
jgi:Fe-S cluster biogenesis protein NfuA/nitrite reductase/ring-hydroxylating ferredoxin subunit